jgi:hypothetical protein
VFALRRDVGARLPSLPLVGRVDKLKAWTGGGQRLRSMISTPPVRFPDTLPIKGREEKGTAALVIHRIPSHND